MYIDLMVEEALEITKIHNSNHHIYRKEKINKLLKCIYNPIPYKKKHQNDGSLLYKHNQEWAVETDTARGIDAIFISASAIENMLIYIVDNNGNIHSKLKK